MRAKYHKSFVLLLFSSLVLLVHSVLPHYHHERIVCFVNKQVSEQCNVDKNTNGIYNISCCDVDHSLSHHHDSSNACDLKSKVVRHDNQEYKVLETISLLPTFYTLFSLNVFYLEMPEFNLFYNIKPYLINYVPPFVGAIFSLRAPPSFLF